MFKLLTSALSGLAILSLIGSTLAPPVRAQSTAAPTALAVLDFQAKGGVSNDEASIISDRIRTQIFRSGRFQVMERANMLSILKEQGFQQTQSNCESTDCSVAAGKLLAVRQIMTGSVSKLGSLYTLSFRIIDVERGAILQDEYRDCRCSLEEVLTQLTGQMVEKLVTPLPSSAAPTPVPKPPTDLSAFSEHIAALPLADRQNFYKANEHYPLLASALSLPLLPFGYIYLNDWGKFWIVTGIEAGIGLLVLGAGATGSTSLLGVISTVGFFGYLGTWGYGVVDSFLTANHKNQELGQLLQLSQNSDHLFLGQQLSYASQPSLPLWQFQTRF